MTPPGPRPRRADEPPSGQAGHRRARSPSRRTMRRRRRENPPAKRQVTVPAQELIETRAADLDHIDGASARDRRRRRRDLDDDDARHRDRRADHRRLDRAAASTGTADIDPYSRATIVRNGELPIGTGDGVAFTATDRRQEEGARRPLRRRRLRRDAAGAVLDADAVRPQGPSRRQFAAALRLHQPGDRRGSPTARSRSASPRARAPATGCRPAASSATR